MPTSFAKIIAFTKVQLQLLVLLLLSQFVYAQSVVAIRFIPKYGNNELMLNSYYKLTATDSLRISTLKFYISNIQFCQNNKIVSTDATCRLLDYKAPSSMLVNTAITSNQPYNTLRFDIGIDSTTNVSGAMGADLDPTKGMYWTWQSGYINIKVEGNSNLCNTRNNEFEFHLGGYKGADFGLQKCSFKMKKKSAIMLSIQLDEFFRALTLVKQNQIMSPSAEAVEIARKFAASFRLN